MKKTFRFTVTKVAAVAAFIVLAGSLTGKLDLIKLDLAIFEHARRNGVDEVIFLIFLIVISLIIDHALGRRQEKREAELEKQRLFVFKATMRTVQDIVNNFLNNFQLLRLDIEEAAPEMSLKLFDEVIQEASAKLKALGDLERVTEKQLASGSGIDYESGNVDRSEDAA